MTAFIYKNRNCMKQGLQKTVFLARVNKFARNYKHREFAPSHNTRRTLNVHETVRRGPGRLLHVVYTKI